MHILAISGSLRVGSANTALLQAAAELAPSQVTITLYNGLDDLPHFSPERDQLNPPESVTELRARLQQADAALICTPEYIHGMPGALKNMLDWLASSGEFVDKPVGVISAGPSDTGGSRAHAALTYTLSILMAKLPGEASLIVPFVRTKLDTSGRLTDLNTIEQLRSVINALGKATVITNR